VALQCRSRGPRGGAARAIPARNSPERVGEGEEQAKGVTRDRLVARVGVGTPLARGYRGAVVLWPLRLGMPAGWRPTRRRARQETEGPL
jgi:hypothetical protein